MNIFEQIVMRTFRVPTPGVDFGTVPSDESEVLVRQLDIALIKVGFKLSRDLGDHLSYLSINEVTDIANQLISVLKNLVGDHIDHNTYFIDFPNNIPDTEEFWLGCIVDTLDNDLAPVIMGQLSEGLVNLLDLPKYGHYQHTWEEMLERHRGYKPTGREQIKILHLGLSLEQEMHQLYLELANSTIPLSSPDRDLLLELARMCIDLPQPNEIPIRENKALINQVRLESGKTLIIDTVTDILRLACALSGGDVTLATKTQFRSFQRAVRKQLLEALDQLIEQDRWRLCDVNRYQGAWKRLGEYLHPGDFGRKYPQAYEVFQVARGDETIRSFAGKAEIAIAQGDLISAIQYLVCTPGMLFRSVDRLSSLALGLDKVTEMGEALCESLKSTMSQVSTRVILSLIQHLDNRVKDHEDQGKFRIFSNTKGTLWVEPDTRPPLPQALVLRILTLLQREIAQRINLSGRVVVDPLMWDIAVPLSDKNKASGFGIAPRGSVMPVSSSIIRLFLYWQQQEERTDYDLSAVMLDKSFGYLGHVSWQNLSEEYATYSGDITDASRGASEFIDIDLTKLPFECHYILPEVNIFAGEPFPQAKQCFMGYMERETLSDGLPFEPQTVKTKSELRGDQSVALPFVMGKIEGQWSVKWMHFFLKGKPWGNRATQNVSLTSRIVQAVMGTQYLTLDWLLGNQEGVLIEENVDQLEPITYIGVFPPEGLPQGSRVITLANLSSLISE